jgi:hypothetical protein
MRPRGWAVARAVILEGEAAVEEITKPGEHQIVQRHRQHRLNTERVRDDPVAAGDEQGQQHPGQAEADHLPDQRRMLRKMPLKCTLDRHGSFGGSRACPLGLSD